ncbi:MAG: prepilin-type N-terminal cleavage/methylation domain-containing protein [Candidatus Omnitrophota bacterium]
MVGMNGFTLLELIIVVIIIAVLVSVALPKLTAMIEFTRSSEALAILGALRTSMERCYLMNNATFEFCNWDTIDVISTPDPNEHFRYGIVQDSLKEASYRMYAVRNTRDFSELCETPLCWDHRVICVQLPGNYYCYGIGVYSKLLVGTPP